VALHSVAAAYDLPWQNIFDKFFYTHSVAHSISQMIGLMTIIGGGLLERLPNIRFAILETGCSWLPYWSWWLDGHYADPRFLKDPKTVFGEDPLPYLKRPPASPSRVGGSFSMPMKRSRCSRCWRWAWPTSSSTPRTTRMKTRGSPGPFNSSKHVKTCRTR